MPPLNPFIVIFSYNIELTSIDTVYPFKFLGILSIALCKELNLPLFSKTFDVSIVESTTRATSDTTPFKSPQLSCLTLSESAVNVPDTFNPSTSKSEEILPDVAFISPVILALVASIDPSDSILKFPLAVTNPSKRIFFALKIISLFDNNSINSGAIVMLLSSSPSSPLAIKLSFCTNKVSFGMLCISISILPSSSV